MRNNPSLSATSSALTFPFGSGLLQLTTVSDCRLAEADTLVNEQASTVYIISKSKICMIPICSFTNAHSLHLAQDFC